MREMSVTSQRGERYLVFSVDGHAGPSLDEDLRAYCPKALLDDYDAYTRAVRADQRAIQENTNDRPGFPRLHGTVPNNLPETWKQALLTTRSAGGQRDPRKRLQDMDEDGIAGDVIFAGGGNGEPMPFEGARFHDRKRDYGHLAAGFHIWNQWLADYVSVDRHRLYGAIQIPMWDIEASVNEIEWGSSVGLQAVNLPAPRSDLSPYNDPAYEPFWSAVEDLELPLLTHAGGGEPPLGAGFEGGAEIVRAEVMWLSRRALWQLIFGGVFRRHPKLKLVFTEQRAGWVGDTLAYLDNVYFSDNRQNANGLGNVRDHDPKRPSEYWASNCYLGGSFLANFEVQRRDEIGIANLMWGADYPHTEGTWPYTRLAMRKTFAGIPEEDVRLILGENAIHVYNVDENALRSVAARIGPTPQELDEPLKPNELPEWRGGQAFRDLGDYV